MNQPWGIVIHIAYLAICFFIAMLIRRSIPIMSRFRIPDAIVAGVLALIAKPGVTALASIKNLGFVAMDTSTFTSIVYHLLAIGFIALSLKKSVRKGQGRTAISAGFYNAVSYCIQGTIGLGLTFILIRTFFPNLFPGFGALLPFGFAQGPMAGTMAIEWSTLSSSQGIPAFPDSTTAASVGFSFSTIGFLWACLVGIPLMNILIRRRKRLGESEPGFAPPPSPPKQEILTGKDRPGQLVDRITTQIVLIAICYFLAYLFLKGVSWAAYGLSGIRHGEAGMIDTVIGIFWGIHFVFGAVIASIVGKIIHRLEDSKVIKKPVTNNPLLQNIGGTAIDFMIAASIAAIDVSILGAYIVPILIVTTVGGLSVIAYTWFLVRKVWPKTYVEHFVGFFGDHTGTVATGLALLRGVDPHFQTSAATDLVYGSAIALPLALPLIFIVGLPVEGFKSGNPNYYIWSLVLPIAYLGLLLLVWFSKPVFRFLTRYSRDEK